MNRIRIYILSIKPDLVSDAVTYLKKKDFNIEVFASSTKLIEMMGKAKPKCIMLSSDAIDDVEQIPKKLAKIYGIPIIGYVEQETMSSLARLYKMQTEYKIRPPIAGAAFYRVIQKVIS